MIKFLKRYFGRKITSDYFISDDIDDIEDDVEDIMRNDEFMTDLNILVLAYTILSRFEPEIATLISSLRVLKLNPQEFAIVMLRIGATLQFLGENQMVALQKVKEADFSRFSEESVIQIHKIATELMDEMEISMDVEPSNDVIGMEAKPRDLSPDELANKLIDDYLKKSKEKDKDKNKDDNS